MSGYAVVQFEEIDEIPSTGGRWRPIRHRLGITAFGVNAWTARVAGERIISEHEEALPGGDEELYLVTRGSATFELDGEQVRAPAGTLVHAQPGVRRTAVADEPDTTILVVGAPPGEAYELDGWELWQPANVPYEAGDYAAAAELGRELATANPSYSGLLYNTACCESLAGQRAEAIAHLARAIEMKPKFKALAKNDSDFDAVRDDPSFTELLAD